MAEGDVANNERERRYELSVGDHLAIAAYELSGDTIRFTHTEVPEALEGKGVGSRLVAGALADVRRLGLKVVPLCPFVRHYIEKHPEERDLLA